MPPEEAENPGSRVLFLCHLTDSVQLRRIQ
jgi:hypothetical protein